MPRARPPQPASLPRRPIVSAIVPARDEAECIGGVVTALRALRGADGSALIGEVVVADNGSRDDTAAVAGRAGARVIHVPVAGYGRACWEAAAAALGDVLLFVDGDGAADPRDALPLLAAIADGADLAIGVRRWPEPASMSPAQRWGNAFACSLMRWLWRMPVADLGPHRAIRRSAFAALDMQDRSFGWTVEMQLRAHVLGQRVVDCPVRWRARRGGHSKISGTWRGVIGAGAGILGMIARLWWRERRRAAALRATPASSSQPQRTAP